jgi:hypothetical protein
MDKSIIIHPSLANGKGNLIISQRIQGSVIFGNQLYIAVS